MATAAQLLDGDGFNQLVLENGLRTWEQNGYIYAGMKGKNGWELYRTYGPKWARIWVYRQVCTQDNAGGGNLDCRVTASANTPFRILYGRWQTSGNRAIYTVILGDGTNNFANLGAVGATAGASQYLPGPGSTAATSGNITDISGTNAAIVPPAGCIRCAVTAAAQTETATIQLVCELPSGGDAPTVSWAGSTGTPNAAAAVTSTTWVLMP